MTPPPVHAATDVSEVPDTETTGASRIDESRLMDHSYDGIQEYDNPLPGWWRAIFWGSIVFAAGYWVWFHVAPWHSTPAGKYQAALAEYEEGREARAAAEARD